MYEFWRKLKKREKSKRKKERANTQWRQGKERQIPGEEGQLRVKADHERWRSTDMQIEEKAQTKIMLNDKQHNSDRGRTRSI